jgi:hypothetical protein
MPVYVPQFALPSSRKSHTCPQLRNDPRTLVPDWLVFYTCSKHVVYEKLTSHAKCNNISPFAMTNSLKRKVLSKEAVS